MFYQDSSLEQYKYFNGDIIDNWADSTNSPKKELLSGGYPIQHLMNEMKTKIIGGGNIGELTRFENLVIPAGLVLENYGGKSNNMDYTLKEDELISDAKMSELFELITIKKGGVNKTRKVFKIKTY